MDNDQIKRVAAALVAKDVPYDGRSPFWDGNTMREIEDPLDSDSILDGRGGPYSYTRLSAKLMPVFSVDRVSLLSPQNVVADDEEIFVAENETRHFAIQALPVDYHLIVADAISRMEQGLCHSVQLNCRCEAAGFAGLIDTAGGKLMLGVTAYLLTENGSVYECQYAGVGNYSDILVEAKMMLQRTFR